MAKRWAVNVLVGLAVAAIFVPLFLTAPGLTTLPISILQYLQYHIDPLIAAMAVAQVVLVGAALLLLDRQVRLAQVAV